MATRSSSLTPDRWHEDLERTDALAAIAAALAQGGETSALVQFIVESARVVLGGRSARLDMIEADSDDPTSRRLVAVSGRVRHAVGTVRPPEEGAAGYTVRTGRSVLAREVSAGRVEPADAAGSLSPFICDESAAVVPLLGPHGVIGVLSVLDPRPDRFDAADVELLSLFASLAADVGQRLEQEQAQVIRLRTQSLALDQVSEGTAYVDSEGCIARTNLAFAKLVGEDRDLIVGRPIATVLGPGSSWTALHGQIGWHGDLRTDVTLRRSNGELIDVALRLLAVDVDKGPAAVETLLIVSESNSTTEAEAALRRQATLDVLTGLANRRSVLDALGSVLARATPCRQVALVVVNLDRFRKVNDALGHWGGDDLLVATAERFRAELGDRYLLGRLGGDEFAVVVETGIGAVEALEVAERMATALQAPVHLDGRRVVLTASIGVAVAEEAGDSGSLLRNADAAVHQAKSAGGDTVVLFDCAVFAARSDDLCLEEQLRVAITDGQLRVAFQPFYNLRSGRLEGFESLVRWAHPTRGLLLPGEFLPLAEETGLIARIGEWVLAESARLLAPLHHERPHLVLGVNVSPRQLAGDAIVHQLDRVVADSGLPAGAFVLEITESLAMRAGFEQTLHQLRQRGAHIAIDDLGTGYSNLAYLKRLPVSTLKLDQSFVAGLAVDRRDRAIIEGLMGIGASLGMSVVAEGIETPEQLALLRRMRCAFGQGNLLGPATLVEDRPPAEWPAFIDATGRPVDG